MNEKKIGEGFDMFDTIEEAKGEYDTSDNVECELTDDIINALRGGKCLAIPAYDITVFITASKK